MCVYCELLKTAEVPVEPHVDARRLHEVGVPRLENQSFGGDLGADVAVGQQHGERLSVVGDPSHATDWRRAIRLTTAS